MKKIGSIGRVLSKGKAKVDEVKVRLSKFYKQTSWQKVFKLAEIDNRHFVNWFYKNKKSLFREYASDWVIIMPKTRLEFADDYLDFVIEVYEEHTGRDVDEE